MPDASQLPAPAKPSDSPFHAGESDVQQRANVRDFAETSGRRTIRHAMPEQHRQFFSEQPFMIFGGVDAGGQPWATIRTGEPGFVTAPDPTTLRIANGTLEGDPLAEAWQVGAWIGGLGIAPQTRRRNRVNGIVSGIDADVVTLQVLQSFGNCPKYIRRRTPDAPPQGRPPTPALSRRTALNADDRALIARADTFYIASANLAAEAGVARGVDVSHRGGQPGFVRIDDDVTLTAPDYSGNRYFNTLGNLAREPRAGLLFLDFANGDLLYLAVRAEIVWDAPDLASFPLAERLVRCHIVDVRRSDGALPLRWTDGEIAREFAPST